MQCNMIGAGRLGKNIALALSHANLITLDFVCNLNLSSAQQACIELGMGKAIENINQLPSADVTWITSNDDAIPAIVMHLAQQPTLKPGSFVIHCSGVLSSATLAPLKARGCHVASIHPLKAFKSNYLDSQAFSQVNCILDGDELVCNWIKCCFNLLGAHLISIEPEAKAIYHAAAVMASNYLITLAACSEELLLTAGLTSEQAKTRVMQLMQGNLTNLKTADSFTDALTGPLMRGDVKTIELHLKAITNSQILQLYKAAGLATLPLTGLNQDKYTLIQQQLQTGDVSRETSADY